MWLDGQMQAIRTVANPEKLRHIGPVSRTWHLRWREQDEEKRRPASVTPGRAAAS